MIRRMMLIGVFVLTAIGVRSGLLLDEDFEAQRFPLPGWTSRGGGLAVKGVSTSGMKSVTLEPCRNTPISLRHNACSERYVSTSCIISEWSSTTPCYRQALPHNEEEKDSSVDTWAASTRGDCSISDFPYTMGFEKGFVPPSGWVSWHEGEGIQTWKASNMGAFAGKYSASVWHNYANEQSMLVTPSFILPETGDMVASFAWGGAPCSYLMSGCENEPVVELPTDEVDDAGGTLYFEIRTSDDNEWTPLAYTQERSKWRHKYVSLADYAGQRVTLRWRFVSTGNSGVSIGGALDEIYVGDIAGMPTLGLDKREASPLVVYPNPTADCLYWHGGKARVKVYDLTGSCVLEQEDAGFVSLSHLPAGLYVVMVRCGEDMVLERVIKQ